MLQRMYACFEEDQARIAPGRLAEVRFEDPIADPVGPMERIYKAIGLSDFELARPAIAERTGQMAGYQPNIHALSAEIRRDIDRHWEAYIQRYGTRVA